MKNVIPDNKMAGNNPWLLFLKEFRKKNPKLSLKMAMKQASQKYKKKTPKPKKKNAKN